MYERYQHNEEARRAGILLGRHKICNQNIIETMEVKESQNWGINSLGQRQTKQFSQGRPPNFYKDLLSLGRKVVRIITDMFTDISTMK